MPQDGQSDRGGRVHDESSKVGDHPPVLLETAGEQRRGNGSQPIDNHAGRQHPDQVGRGG